MGWGLQVAGFNILAGKLACWSAHKLIPPASIFLTLGILGNLTHFRQCFLLSDFYAHKLLKN